MATETTTQAAPPAPRVSDKMGGSYETPAPPAKGGSFIAPGPASAPREPDGVRDDLGRATDFKPRGFNAAHVMVENGIDPSSDEGRAIAEGEAELKWEWRDKFNEKSIGAVWATKVISDATGGEVGRWLDSSGIGNSPVAVKFFSSVADALAAGPVPGAPADPSARAQWAAEELNARMGGTLADFMSAAGLSTDTKISGFFSKIADLLTTGNGDSTNPAAARREIDRMVSDPRYLKGELSPSEKKQYQARLEMLYRRLV